MYSNLRVEKYAKQSIINLEERIRHVIQSFKKRLKKKEKYKGQWNRRELKAEARINLKQNFWVMVFVCLLMAFMFAEYGDSFYMIKAYNEGYKEIQKAYQPKDYEEKMDDPGSGLDKLLEKAGISLNDKGGMNVIAKRGSLGGLRKEKINYGREKKVATVFRFCRV